MKEALKLALEALSILKPTNWLDAELQIQAWEAIKEALAQDKQSPSQAPPFSVQQAYAMAQVCLDIHAALGCAWGNNVYLTISQLKASSPQPEQERVAPTCERCADEIVENNAGLCANCLPAICTEQEPVFKWCSVFQEMPTEYSYLLFCFGVHVVEGSYTEKGWASLAYGEAQPDFWAYMPPAPHPKRNQELYAMPLQRPWVGLTDEEQQQAYNQWQNDGWGVFYKALEAKLEEKNT